MRVEESIEISRPSEEVWRFVAEPTNDPLWCGKVRSVEQTEPGHWKLVHKPVPLRPATELEVEHLVVDPPSRLTLREADAASVFEVEYRLEPTPAGTRFTQVSDFEWKKLPRVLHKAFGSGVRRDVRRQLSALKAVLEKS